MKHTENWRVKQVYEPGIISEAMDTDPDREELEKLANQLNEVANPPSN